MQEAPEPSRATAPAAAPSRTLTHLTRGVRLTRRAVALLVVTALLLLSYISSLRIYLQQERQFAQHEASIAQRQADIASLQDQVERWQDPDYVSAQARARLGWVLPGEKGYKVIGPDGKVVDPEVTISTSSTLPSDEHSTTWWERLTGSMAAADAPVAATPTPTPAPITVKPSTSATSSTQR